MAACPTCGKDLTYITQYGRWYCYAEKKYAPKDFAKPAATPTEDTGTAVSASGASDEGSHDGHYHCPSCGRELTFIEQYGRYYCYEESKYAPRDVQPVSAKEPEIVAAPLEAEPNPSEPALAVTSEPPQTAPDGPQAISSDSPAEGNPEPRQPEAASSPDSPPAQGQEPPPSSSPPPGTAAPAESAEPPKPELRRDAVTKAKKTRLVEWCRAYGLDATGSRTALRDRLLQYMDQHHIDETEEEAAEEAEEAPAEIPAAAPESGAPAAESNGFEPAPAAEPMPHTEPLAETKAEPEATAVAGETEPEPAPSPAPPVTAVRVEPAAPVGPPRAAPATAPTPSPPPSPAVEIAKPLPCPTCGKDLTYIAKYDRLYCYAEGKYAPKDYGKATPEPARAAVLEAPRLTPAPPAEAPPRVAPPPVVVEVPKVEARVANPCPTCGRPLRYVKDYDRWWCEAEKKYAPKDYGKKAPHACPTCGKELTWIPEYQRWYCYSEFKYGPKTMPPPAAGAAVVAVERAGTAVPVVRVQPAVARPEAAAIVSGVTRAEHLHGKPTIGIALAATGFALLLVQNFITGVLPVLGVAAYDPISPNGVTITKIMILIGFTGLVLALAGVVIGLRSVRSR